MMVPVTASNTTCVNLDISTPYSSRLKSPLDVIGVAKQYIGADGQCQPGWPHPAAGFGRRFLLATVNEDGGLKPTEAWRLALLIRRRWSSWFDGVAPRSGRAPSQPNWFRRRKSIGCGRRGSRFQ